MPGASRVMQESRFLKEFAHFGRIMGSEELAVAYGQLEHRALQMVEHHFQIVEIDVGAFRRTFEEVLGMLDDVLIERRTGRNQNCDRHLLTTPGAASALPRRGDGPRIAGHHHSVQRSDINAEFQCVGGDHGLDLAIA